jgi:GNAT superfamily N-acetyltransferase
VEADLPDLLVPLHSGLPACQKIVGIWIGRPLAHQAPLVLAFVSGEFGSGWEAEARTAFASVSPTLLVAVSEGSGAILGFCCWDCTARGFLGPVGVSEASRGSGTGRALVVSVLQSMRESGYGYAVIGDAGPLGFFRKCCDARLIEGSDPGIYGNPIREQNRR